MKRNYIIGLIVVIIIAVSAAAIVKNSQKPSDSVQKSDKIQIVASFYPLYFFAEQIGGDKVSVINITPAGVEPHEYEPTARNIATIENSRLLILNGGGLETWSGDIIKNIDPNRIEIIIAGDGLFNQKSEENGKSTADSHIWLSPILAQKIADKVSEALIQINSSNKDYYESNANALKAGLNDLDAAYRQGLSDCGERNIITSHNAFGYLAVEYGLNQVSIAGLSPGAEPSPKELADIAKFVKDNNVKYILFESLANPKLANTLASETEAKTLELNPLEGLTNNEISQGKNYFSEMRDNLANLQTALQCKQTPALIGDNAIR